MMNERCSKIALKIFRLDYIYWTIRRVAQVHMERKISNCKLSVNYKIEHNNGKRVTTISLPKAPVTQPTRVCVRMRIFKIYY